MRLRYDPPPLRHLYFPGQEIIDPNNRKKISPIDHLPWTGAQEEYWNNLAARVFVAGGGKEFLTYLKDITIHRVGNFNLSDAELRHMEGARWLVSVVMQRVTAGKQQGDIHNVVPLS